MELTPYDDVAVPQKAPKKDIEPRVMTVDVTRLLRRIVQPDLEDSGESVVMLAQRADTSARTVYRVLAGTTDTISLDLADRLCLACDSHLMACRLVWPDGVIANYLD